MCKTIHLSSVLPKNMSTTPLPPPLSRVDITSIWVSYFKYRSENDEDSTSLDGSDFENVLDVVQNLLKHVEYQDEIIAAQSREVFRKTRSEYIWRS